MRFLLEETARVRQPDYTGENRCLPCTVINVGIAAVLAAVVGVITTVWTGTIVLLGSLAVIYLRGYLVPGTPRLTERYLPPWILGLFGKEPVPNRTLEARLEDDPWRMLTAAGVVERSTTENVRLAENVRTSLHREASRYAETSPTASDVAEILDATEIAEQGKRAFSIDGTKLLRWDSDAAFALDAAADSLLRDRLDDWPALDRDVRLDVLRRIRLLSNRCPACDGLLERQSERVDPCCQTTHIIIWSTCRGCDAFLGEVSVPESSAESWFRLEGIPEATTGSSDTDQ